MTDKPNNPPAYPCVSESSHLQAGMTMRQAYKIALATGMFASKDTMEGIAVASRDERVTFDVVFAATTAEFADAMLAEDAAHEAKECEHE